MVRISIFIPLTLTLSHRNPRESADMYFLTKTNRPTPKPMLERRAFL
jgi:hypothetical protein